LDLGRGRFLRGTWCLPRVEIEQLSENWKWILVWAELYYIGFIAGPESGIRTPDPGRQGSMQILTLTRLKSHRNVIFPWKRCYH
jgi:hypothetical protein